jgi:hypothetical protein
VPGLGQDGRVHRVAQPPRRAGRGPGEAVAARDAVRAAVAAAAGAGAARATSAALLRLRLRLRLLPAAPRYYSTN